VVRPGPGLGLGALAVGAFCAPSWRQDNYEIQVYGADTVAPGATMVELHNNFTVEGSKSIMDGVRPTNHAWHETIGDHIRPRFRVKAGYDITKKINAGFEYYGALGPFTGFDMLRDQQQQIFPCVDLNVSPNLEFNFGVGVGMTQGTDHLIVKMILGRRFGGGSHN
jgi:hypothetical protein